MSIITEYFRTREDGIKLYITYSNKNMTIVKTETGEEYSEAIDVEGADFAYMETDKTIEQFETETL